MLTRQLAMAGVGLFLGLAMTAQGQLPENHATTEMLPDGTVLVDGVPFPSWQEYFASDFARQRGARCALPKVKADPNDQNRAAAGGSGADCSQTLTNPAGEYDPIQGLYRIPVVVHELRDTLGNGTLTQQLIDSQIDVLNEDFLALMGTNGATGSNIEIDFYLAGHDVTVNNTWFADGGSYWNTLNWDPTLYMNIYTNQASGALGYVPGLPAGGTAGASFDRVVIHYEAFGRFSAATNYDLGRTATHEVGHYLGLFHVFEECDGGDPLSSGDLVSDTPSQEDENFFCNVGNSCGVTDFTGNYMDYNYDACLYAFTPTQGRRMRCTLLYWRPLLFEDLGGCEAVVDCNLNCIEDAMELSGGSEQDCNSNAIPDSCEIADATANDCDLNGVPDSCEDCNGNGIGDACEFSGIFTDDSPVIPSFGASITPELYDYTIAAPPAPIGNVTFSFSANGLLAGTNIVMVKLNGESIGDAFLTTGVSCPVVSEDEITISAALFLSHTGGGDAIIGMQTWNYLVDACGDNTWISVSTSYGADTGSTDTNGNMVPDECDLARGDSDLDGIVGINDFLAVLAEWGVCGAPCPEDADLDGSVGILDFLTVLANWG